MSRMSKRELEELIPDFARAEYEAQKAQKEKEQAALIEAMTTPVDRGGDGNTMDNETNETNNHYEAPRTAFLVIRPDEMLHFSEQPYDTGMSYVVMLIETPPFPGINHTESRNLAVLCAGQYNTENGESGEQVRWGWVHLEAATKEQIGQGLASMNAEVGRWYYMLLSGGLGNRPRSDFKVSVSDD